MTARGKKKVGGLAVLLALLGAAAWSASAATGWPAFLPPREGFPADVVAAVERTWTHWTLHRTVRGPRARVPFDLYAALVDTPDLTAAAARYKSLARDDVWPVGDDLYEASDHDGSRGFYRVLARERERRVMFSWGEHSGNLLGTIRGDALTVLTLEPAAGGIEQTLTAYVRIDNRFVAAVAQALMLLFGDIADKKLSEGVVVATRVAEWAVTQPGDFCGWLGRSGLPPARRALVQSLVPGCS